MFNQKRITALLALAITASIILAGCASGPYGTETFDVSGFDRIRVDTFGEFIIEQGSGESLSIEAPRDYLRYIIAEVEGDTLVISTRRGFFGGPVRRAVFTIGVEELEAISLAGAGAIKIFTLDTDSLDVNLSGAGSIEIDDLNANRLDVNLSSAGAIIIAGKVDKQDVNISGVGSYEAGDLETEDTEVLMSGAGSAVVWALEDLEVEVSGVGTVTYFGNPSIYQNITGLGSVNSRGDRN
jgi:hypothetical protein